MRIPGVIDGVAVRIMVVGKIVPTAVKLEVPYGC